MVSWGLLESPLFLWVWWGRPLVSRRGPSLCAVASADDLQHPVDGVEILAVDQLQVERQKLDLLVLGQVRIGLDEPAERLMVLAEEDRQDGGPLVTIQGHLVSPPYACLACALLVWPAGSLPPRAPPSVFPGKRCLRIHRPTSSLPLASHSFS